MRELAHTLPTRWPRCTVHGGLRVVSDTGFSPQGSLCVRDAIALGATGPLPLSPKITVGGTRGWDDEGLHCDDPHCETGRGDTTRPRSTDTGLLRPRSRGHWGQRGHPHATVALPGAGAVAGQRSRQRQARRDGDINALCDASQDAQRVSRAWCGCVGALPGQGGLVRAPTALASPCRAVPTPPGRGCHKDPQRLLARPAIHDLLQSS